MRSKLSSHKNTTPIDFDVSSGGVISVLAGAGSLSALELAGVNLRMRGGASGGAIVTALSAIGRTPKELLRLGITEDFGAKVDLNGGILGSLETAKRTLRNLIRKYSKDQRIELLTNEENWLTTGLLGTVNLGIFIEKHAAELGMSNTWPENYWTVATKNDGSQVVFTRDGVFHLTLEGKKIQLTDEPAPLSLAVRASGAIPGVMTAIEFMDMLLFDGAMSRDGHCPSGIRIRHFDANPEQILACRIGEDAQHYIMGPAQRTVRRMLMIHPDFHWGPETTGVMEFRPAIEHIHGLKFNLSPDEKWLAILIAFDACAHALAFNGLLHGKQLKEAREIMRAIGYWRNLQPAAVDAEQILAPRAEKVFAEHGLY
jgi:hypothetical protein